MTDYEMTKHCAELLGLGYVRPCEENPRAVEYNADPQESAWMVYCPLDDDGEAMGLVKALNIVVERERTQSQFGVTLIPDRVKGKCLTVQVVRQADDLNRAIVEVVARYQEERMRRVDSRHPEKS